MSRVTVRVIRWLCEPRWSPLEIGAYALGYAIATRLLGWWGR